MKRGQITLFIVLAIVVVLLLSIGIYYRTAVYSFIKNIELQKITVTSEEAKYVRETIEDNLEYVVYSGLEEIGNSNWVWSGLYLDYPEEHFEPEESILPRASYAYYLGENLVPSREYLENELSKHINYNLRVHSANLETSEKFEFFSRDIKSEVNIEDDYVDINVEWSTGIKIGDMVKNIPNKYHMRAPVRLGKILDAVNYLVEKQDGNWVCLSCMNDLGRENFNFTHFKVPDGYYFYLFDEESHLKKIPYINKDEPYEFRFAFKVE